MAIDSRSDNKDNDNRKPGTVRIPEGGEAVRETRSEGAEYLHAESLDPTEGHLSVQVMRNVET